MNAEQRQNFLDAFQVIEGELCDRCHTFLKEIFINPLIFDKVRTLKHYVFDPLLDEMAEPKGHKEQKLLSLKENKAYFEEELNKISEAIKQLS